MEGGRQVDGDDLVPFLDRKILHRRDELDARIVDEDVDAAECPLGDARSVDVSRNVFRRSEMAYFLQQFLNGLHIGSIYALLAFGYALTYGILRRANLAHGAIFAFGGQVGILATVFAWNVLWLTLPAALGFGMLLAFAYAGLAAHVVSRTVLEPLRAGNPNTIVAATLAVAIVLMELGRLLLA